jgi:hypothetical protein
MFSSLRWLLACFAALSLTGCPSAANLSSARTLDRGRVQAFGALSAYGLRGSDGSLVALPQIDVGARYGLTDRVELGARAWFIGASVDSKLALVRPESAESGLNVSVAPGVGYQGSWGLYGSLVDSNAGATSVVSLSLPLLFGIRFRGSHELTFGLRGIDQLLLSSRSGRIEAGHLVWLGGSVGAGFRVAPSVRLVPEVGAVYPFVPGTRSLELLFFQAGLGVLVGSD